MIVPVDRTSELVSLLLLGNTKATEDSLFFTGDGESRHPFTTLATELSDKIRDMRTFLHSNKRKYEDFSARGMSDSERDEVDGAVANFLEYALGHIEDLKNEAAAESQSGSTAGSFAAHKLGVVVIINEELQVVAKQSEQLRGIRIKRAIAGGSRKQVQVDDEVAKQVAMEMRRRDSDDQPNDAAMEEADASLVQMFEAENASLVNELVETRERVQEVERTVAEIAKLNHLFATKVIEQAKDIETLYELAVDASNYVDYGNKELAKMREQGPLVTYMIAGFIFFITIFLFLYDWFSS